MYPYYLNKFYIFFYWYLNYNSLLHNIDRINAILYYFHLLYNDLNQILYYIYLFFYIISYTLS